MKCLCGGLAVGAILGCIGMYFFYKPLSDVNEEILKNRRLGYVIITNQDSIKKKIDLVDRQRDSIRKEIKENGLNISANLKIILEKQ